MVAIVEPKLELMLREMARVAYGVAQEIEESGLIKELRKKRKYRKFVRKLAPLIGLARAEWPEGVMELSRLSREGAPPRHKSDR
jgi:hypothetical protein